MSTPEEETHTISSRDSSFFSLTSGNSVYFSAKDSLSASGENVENDVSQGPGATSTPKKLELKKPKLNLKDGGETGGEGDMIDGEENESSPGGSGSAASSTTLEEAESMSSFSDAADYCSSNGNGDLGDDESLPNARQNLVKRTPSATSVEVKRGISRLCSNIANVEDSVVDVSKKKEIKDALKIKDLMALSELAVTEGGLLSNALREHSWSLLLGISSSELTKNRGNSFKIEYPDVTEQVQNLVKLDVARVLKRFPPGLSDPQQNHLQTALSSLICAVLHKNPDAHYYQGFHDISLTFLLVASVESNPYLAYLCLNKMIETNLEPHMEPTMDSTHELIHTIYSIIEKENQKLYTKIVIEAKCPVAFCLPWVLTWFSHTLPDDSDVFRLYDYILGSQKVVDPPHLIPIFISAALVLRSATKILQDNDLIDIATMHQALSKLPSELTSLEPWLKESTQLMRKYKGREFALVQRGKKIKEFQNNLWNDDSNNNNRSRVPARRRDNLFIYMSRIIFVRHRWTTLSLVVMLTAYFFQSRYRRPLFQVEFLRSAVDSYAPAPMRRFLQFALEDEPASE